MLLRLLQVALIPVVLWFFLPCFLAEILFQFRTEWQASQKRWVVLETIGTCLEVVFLLVLTVNLWTFGERKDHGKRVYGLQHRNLLLYSGFPVILLVLFFEFAWTCRISSKRSKFKFALSAVLCFWAAVEIPRLRRQKEKKSVYGLQHGRLHLDAHVPMWMNMGYWKVDDCRPSKPKSLAEACRDLLNLVLAEAEFPKEVATDRSRCLIDVGFGCGEQTIHLMSDKPVSTADALWWDDGPHHQLYFDQYIGITQDKAQFQYAQKRINEWNRNKSEAKSEIAVFCGDAASPAKWSDDLLATIDSARSKSRDTWLLALDTAYHFHPSRWVLIEHASRTFDASFMGFDLCLSPKTTTLQKLSLRIMTTVMSSPWANFVTPKAYREKLVDLGYSADAIKIVDISEHVFAPLAAYMDEQDQRLKMLGLGLGGFQAAKWLFRWWGTTGVVRGVVVVAKRDSSFGAQQM